MPKIKPALKPFPIGKPLPSLNDNNLLNDEIDSQTEIFVDDNYQPWIDDTKPDLNFPTMAVNSGLDEKKL